MPHALLLYPSIPSDEYFDPFIEDETLRAAAIGAFGSDYAAMAFATKESVEELAQVRSMTCPGDPGCLGGIIIPLPVVPSPHMPGDFNLFGVISLAGGRLGHFARHLRGHREPKDGVLDARGLVLGIRGVHAVVEVVADDLDEASERLMQLTDHPDVEGLSTFVTTRERARGWGNELALSH